MSEEQGKEGQEWGLHDPPPGAWWGGFGIWKDDTDAADAKFWVQTAEDARRSCIILNALESAARDDKARMFLMRFQLRTAWHNLGCRCMFDDQHNKLVEDPHCPYHGLASDKAWESVEGFRDDGTPLLSSSPVAQGGTDKNGGG